MTGSGNRAGTTVLELLVALAVISMACLLGGRLLQGHLRQLNRTAAGQMVESQVGRFRNELLRNWESRCADAFHPGEWFRVEGEAGAGWISVNRIWIRTYSAEGGIRAAVLERTGEGWQWLFRGLADGSEAAPRVRLGYSSEVRLQSPSSSYSGGEVPDRVSIELRDGSSGSLLDAFAIVGRW